MNTYSGPERRLRVLDRRSEAAGRRFRDGGRRAEDAHLPRSLERDRRVRSKDRRAEPPVMKRGPR